MVEADHDIRTIAQPAVHTPKQEGPERPTPDERPSSDERQCTQEVLNAEIDMLNAEIDRHLAGLRGEAPK